MTDNPFDADPFAQTNPWEINQPAPQAPSSTTTQEAASMTNSDYEAFTATLKFGGGYDAPWLVVRGSSAEETNERIKQAMTSGLMATVSQAAGHVISLGPAKPGADSAP